MWMAGGALATKGRSKESTNAILEGNNDKNVGSRLIAAILRGLDCFAQRSMSAIVGRRRSLRTNGVTVPVGSGRTSSAMSLSVLRAVRSARQ